MLILHKRLLFHIFDEYFDFRSIFELSQTCKKANKLFKEYFNGNTNCDKAKLYIYTHIRKKLIFKKIFKYSELIKNLPRHRQVKINKKITKLQNMKINNCAIVFSPKYKIEYLINDLFPELHRYFKISESEYNLIKRVKLLPKWTGYFNDEMKFKSEQQKTEYYIGRLKAGLPVNYCNENILFWAVYKRKFDFAERHVNYANGLTFLLMTMRDIPMSFLKLINRRYEMTTGIFSVEAEDYFSICHVTHDFKMLDKSAENCINFCRFKLKTRYLFNYIKYLGDKRPKNYNLLLKDLLLQATAGDKKYILEFFNNSTGTCSSPSSSLEKKTNSNFFWNYIKKN